MTSMDVLSTVSLIASCASLALAVFTIWFARATERENRENYQRSRDVLAEIDKRATVTERTVTDAQKQLLDTFTALLNKSITPDKPDMGEQFGMAFMQMMMDDPTKASKVLDKIKPLMEFGQQQKKDLG